MELSRTLKSTPNENNDLYRPTLHASDFAASDFSGQFYGSLASFLLPVVLHLSTVKANQTAPYSALSARLRPLSGLPKAVSPFSFRSVNFARHAHFSVSPLI
jgi:hypothetical protein